MRLGLDNPSGSLGWNHSCVRFLGEVRTTQIRVDSSQTGREGSGDRERYRMLQSECKHTDRTLMPRMLSWLIGGASETRRFLTQESTYYFSQMDWRSKQRYHRKSASVLDLGNHYGKTFFRLAGAVCATTGGMDEENKNLGIKTREFRREYF